MEVHDAGGAKVLNRPGRASRCRKGARNSYTAFAPRYGSFKKGAGGHRTEANPPTAWLMAVTSLTRIPWTKRRRVMHAYAGRWGGGGGSLGRSVMLVGGRSDT